MTVRPNAAATAAGLLVAGLLATGLLATGPATATDDKPVELTISNHKFHPARLEVPAGRLFTLRIRNTDATPEHFDSRDLRIEKVIRGNSVGVMTIRPLEPGEYRFVGERHETTATGVMIAK